MTKNKNRNIILFVNKVPQEAVFSIRKNSKRNKVRYKIALIIDSKKRSKKETSNDNNIDIVITCNLDKPIQVAKSLSPYQDQLLAITCRGDANIPDFIKIIPNVPYLRTPTTGSLLWATNKIQMRQRLRAADKKLSPPSIVISDSTKETLRQIKEKVGFPVILKPAELALSLLVNICYHKEELNETLSKSLRKIKKVYKENDRKQEPKLIAERFLEGDMYSIDAYVTSRGKVRCCPIINVTTGRSIGFDDFFGYRHITPTLLKKQAINDAEETTAAAIHALGLRSTTVHVELMKTEDGWKIIELGPRIGGFRHKMYELAYGIDHSWNDILTRIPKKPTVPKKSKGWATAMKFFAKEEGRLKQLKGIQKIGDLESLIEIKVNKKIGDRCLFAKNGGKSICDVILFNKNRSELLADIRRIERTLIIKTEKTNGKTNTKKKKRNQ